MTNVSQQKIRAIASNGRPRVLHILKSLAIGGIETWLLHMLRQHQQFAVQHEILLMQEEPGPLEPEVRGLGIPIHRVPMDGSRLLWLAKLRRFLVAEGPFAAVHSHINHVYSAPALAMAKMAGVPVRIAHSHEARSQGKDFQAFRHRLARNVAIKWFSHVATRRIGISEAAMEEISGSNWRDDPSASILIYGFDFSQNEQASERALELRAALGINGGPIIGHVGRFDPVKNHDFLLRCFAAYAKDVPSAHLVMVGQGRLRPSIEGLSSELGISEQVHFAGTTQDVAAYMALFDLFLFPSFSEGLGIVCLEAQAAGTRSLVSDTIPDEVGVIPEALEKLPLDASTAEWSAAIKRLISLPPPDAPDWRRNVEHSRFGIRRCVHELNDIYLAELGRHA